MTDFSLDPEGLTHIATTLHSVSESLSSAVTQMGGAPDCGLTSAHVQRALERIVDDIKQIGQTFESLGDAVKSARDGYLRVEDENDARIHGVGYGVRSRP